MSQLSAVAVEALSSLVVFEHPLDFELVSEVAGIDRSLLLEVLEEAAAAGALQIKAGRVVLDPSAKDSLYQRLGPKGQARSHAGRVPSLL